MQDDLQHVLQTFKAVETGQTEGIETYIAPTYLNRESVDDGRSESRGPAEFVETVKWLRSSFSELSFSHRDVFRCGDRAVVITVMAGRQTGDFFGIPPSGRHFSQNQIHVFRLDGQNRIVEHRAQRDDLGLRRQLTAEMQRADVDFEM